MSLCFHFQLFPLRSYHFQYFIFQLHLKIYSLNWKQLVDFLKFFKVQLILFTHYLYLATQIQQIISLQWYLINEVFDQLLKETIDLIRLVFMFLNIEMLNLNLWRMHFVFAKKFLNYELDLDELFCVGFGIYSDI